MTRILKCAACLLALAATPALADPLVAMLKIALQRQAERNEQGREDDSLGLAEGSPPA